MNFRLRFAPEIEGDVLDGYSWYESKADGLGEDFLRIFYAWSSEISRNPLIHRKVYGDFRRRLFKRFPYSIYFLIEDDLIIIFGLFHCAKDPRKIVEILNSREKPKTWDFWREEVESSKMPLVRRMMTSPAPNGDRHHYSFDRDDWRCTESSGLLGPIDDISHLWPLPFGCQRLLCRHGWFGTKKTWTK